MKTRKLKQRNFFFCLLCLPFGKIKNLPKVFIYSFILLSVHGWGDGNCTKVSLLLSPAEDECGDSDPRGALSSCFHQRISRDGGEPLPNSNRFKIDTNHNYSFSDIYSRFVFLQYVFLFYDICPKWNVCISSSSTVLQQTAQLLQWRPQGSRSCLQAIKCEL